MRYYHILTKDLKSKENKYQQQHWESGSYKQCIRKWKGVSTLDHSL